MYWTKPARKSKEKEEEEEVRGKVQKKKNRTTTYWTSPSCASAYGHFCYLPIKFP